MQHKRRMFPDFCISMRQDDAWHAAAHPCMFFSHVPGHAAHRKLVYRLLVWGHTSNDMLSGLLHDALHHGV